MTVAAVVLSSAAITVVRGLGSDVGEALQCFPSLPGGLESRRRAAVMVLRDAARGYPSETGRQVREAAAAVVHYSRYQRVAMAAHRDDCFIRARRQPV